MTRPRASRTVPVFARLVTLLAMLLVVVPWQGNLDRIAPSRSIPVPSAAADPRTATLTLLERGAAWRVEPDYSYFLTFHENAAAGNPWHLVSAYGPWGFVYRGYHPATFGAVIVVWIALALALWHGALRSLRARGASEIVVLASLVLLIAALAADPRYLVLLLIPAMLLFDEHRDPALVVATAFVATVKGTSLFVAAVVVAVLAVDDLRRRRWPTASLALAGLFHVCLAAGHVSLPEVPAFLHDTFSFSAAYGDAFALSEAPIALALAELTLIGIVVIAALALERGAIVAAGMGLTILLFAKSVFTRYDAFHGQEATPWLVALFALALPSVARRFPPKRRGVAGLLLAAAGALRIAAQVPFAELGRQWPAATHVAAAKRQSDELFAAELRGIRARNPLPPLQGSIDFIGQRQCVLFANGTRYLPRPVFQSYMAVNARLAEENGAAVAQRVAPDWLLLEMGLLDQRYPSLEDPFVWRAMLERYEVAAVRGSLALLRRAGSPRTLVAARPVALHGRLHEPVAIPSTADSLLWATIDVRRTAAGRLLALAKPSPLTMLVTTRAGAARYRIVPGLARQGFLLSPLIATAADFARVSNGEGGAVPEVFAITVEGDESYERAFEVTLVPLMLRPAAAPAKRPL
jgi:hypothetical protein